VELLVTHIQCSTYAMQHRFSAVMSVHSAMQVVLQWMHASLCVCTAVHKAIPGMVLDVGVLLFNLVDVAQGQILDQF
jgi:hypothetical protein